jgi:hypothetical protein
VVATELGKHLAERGHDIPFISNASPLRLRELPPRICFHVVDQDDHPRLKQFPHSLTIVGSTPSFKPVTEWSINESDAVTAVSAFLAAETGRQLSLRRPIALVPRYEEIYQWVVGDAR